MSDDVGEYTGSDSADMAPSPGGEMDGSESEVAEIDAEMDEISGMDEPSGMDEAGVGTSDEVSPMLEYEEELAYDEELQGVAVSDPFADATPYGSESFEDGGAGQFGPQGAVVAENREAFASMGITPTEAELDPSPGSGYVKGNPNPE